jgi:hypothetical protein
MPVPFTGGCACGAVRYECSAEPMMAVNCRCCDCQRSSGAPFATVLIVPKATVTFSSEIKLHQVKAGSGNMATRGFCPTCGLPLFGQPSGLPIELIGLRAARVWMISAGIG